MTELPKTTFTAETLWQASKESLKDNIDPWPAILTFYYGFMHNIAHRSGDESRIINSLHNLPHILRIQHQHMSQSTPQILKENDSPWPTQKDPPTPWIQEETVNDKNDTDKEPHVNVDIDGRATPGMLIHRIGKDIFEPFIQAWLR